MAIEKTAVITGATSGIGRELAERFASNGYSLFITARNQEALKKLCEQFKARYPDAEFEYIAADLGKSGDIEKLCGILSKMKTDVLVNNAGFGMTGEFALCDKEQLDEMLTLNMLALTHITRAVLPGMKQRKSGRIMNVASIAAFMPNPYGAVYAATKAYVKSFSEAISEELKGSGVKVTVLCPGPTQTGFGARSEMDRSLIFSKGVMAADKVADIAYNALQKGKRTVVTGAQNKAIVAAAKLMPAGIVLAAAAFMLKHD